MSSMMSTTGSSEQKFLGIERIIFHKDHRCFKAEEGDTFDFRAGVNLLVGDQGIA